MSHKVPEGPDGLTADWLGAVLGRPVGALGVTRFGQDEGFMGGALYRLTLPDGSLVAKLSPTDPAMRARFAASNAREVAFYTQMSDGLPVPAAHYGAADPVTGASVLILDDLGDHVSVPFVEGLWPRHVDAVLKSLAGVHAAWWNAPGLTGLGGTDILREFDFADTWARYPAALDALLPGTDLPPAMRALGDHCAVHVARIYDRMHDNGPLTVLHRDPQVDNILFAEDGSAVLIDWQMVGKGRGTWDVAYFLISSVPPVRRRKHERRWVEAYHRMLVDKGIHDYGLEDCWQDYLRSVLAKLFVTIVATVELDNSTAHKRAYRRADLVRLLAFIKDHDLTPAIWDFGDD